MCFIVSSLSVLHKRRGWENQLWLSLSQQWELSTKLVLNAVSTGAHVLKGKIYQNYMIDVQVTNSKLYRRATRLLQVDKTT